MTTLTASQVLKLALDAGFSRHHADVMTAVAWYESRWNPNNVGDQTLSKYGSRGLWQVFTGAHSPSELKVGSGPWTPALVAKLTDPATNAHAAHIVFQEQGYQAWSTYNQYHSTKNFKALVSKIAALSLTTPVPVPAPVHQAVPAVVDTKAIAKAEAEVGHPPFNVTDACLKFVRLLYDLAPDGNEPTAFAGWTEAKHKHPGDANPPAGVPVWWSGGSHGAGHVAMSIGTGRIVSSDLAGRGTVSIDQLSDVHTKWGLSYLGWSEDIEGHRVYTPGVPS